MKKIEERFGGYKARFFSFAGDVPSPEVMEEPCAKTVERFGEIDILVNAAGITVSSKASDLPLDVWNKWPRAGAGRSPKSLRRAATR